MIRNTFPRRLFLPLAKSRCLGLLSVGVGRNVNFCELVTHSQGR